MLPRRASPANANRPRAPGFDGINDSASFAGESGDKSPHSTGFALPAVVLGDHALDCGDSSPLSLAKLAESLLFSRASSALALRG
jgi:hypothetical protein